MIHFSRLLDWRFWFTLRPSSLGEKTVLIVAVCLLVLLAGAIFFRVLAKAKKQNPPFVKICKKLYKMLSTMVLVGFVLLFLSYEQIYLLGSHFWFLLWFLGFLTWLGFIIYHFFAKMPKEKEELEQKKRFEKYLPR